MKKNMMQRVERHIIKWNKQLDDLCFKSKNLYNYVNYLIRQEFINSHKLLNEYKLTGQLAKENQIDYRSLPAQTSQQIIKLLFKNWISFFRSIKDWKKHPNKYKGKPNLPGYKDKIKGRGIIIFTKLQSRFKDGYIRFPKNINLTYIKTKVSNVCQVRIVPQSNHFVIEIIYEKEVKKVRELKKNIFLGIDLGINNLATLVTNKGNSMLVNGRILKSINQYYNKEKARLQNFIGDRGTSNRIEKLIFKRNCKVDDYLHKVSRLIINYCIKNHIGNIVIGKNKEWKQDINIGKVNNQKFVSVPYSKLIQMIQYKAEEVGINVILQEESYTSKCDALGLEPIEKHETYIGKRVKRGLFRSSIGQYINADINGALNILRKVIGDSFITKLVSNRGLADNPIRINPYKYIIPSI
jgi:putative transposase